MPIGDFHHRDDFSFPLSCRTPYSPVLFLPPTTVFLSPGIFPSPPREADQEYYVSLFRGMCKVGPKRQPAFLAFVEISMFTWGLCCSFSRKRRLTTHALPCKKPNPREQLESFPETKIGDGGAWPPLLCHASGKDLPGSANC